MKRNYVQAFAYRDRHSEFVIVTRDRNQIKYKNFGQPKLKYPCRTTSTHTRTQVFNDTYVVYRKQLSHPILIGGIAIQTS